MTQFQGSLEKCVEKSPGISDKQLSEMLLGKGVHPSRVNQEARLLVSRGNLRRVRRLDGRIGNYPLKKHTLLEKLFRLIFK
jgi:hypothetical protein